MAFDALIQQGIASAEVFDLDRFPLGREREPSEITPAEVALQGLHKTLKQYAATASDLSMARKQTIDHLSAANTEIASEVADFVARYRLLIERVTELQAKQQVAVNEEYRTRDELYEAEALLAGLRKTYDDIFNDFTAASMVIAEARDTAPEEESPIQKLINELITAEIDRNQKKGLHSAAEHQVAVVTAELEQTQVTIAELEAEAKENERQYKYSKKRTVTGGRHMAEQASRDRLRRQIAKGTILFNRKSKQQQLEVLA